MPHNLLHYGVRDDDIGDHHHKSGLLSRTASNFYEDTVKLNSKCSFQYTVGTKSCSSSLAGDAVATPTGAAPRLGLCGRFLILFLGVICVGIFV